MRRRRLLVALAALAVVAAGCDFPNIVPQGAAPLRYRDQIFTTVVTTSGITYGSAVNASNQTVTLKLDVYRPPATDRITRRAAIVWVHGGGFATGDKTSGEIVDEANRFAKGYVNASINYRVEPGDCTASNPTQTCIKAIQEATPYGIDPTRIAIGGTSAGAITALESATPRPRNPRAPCARPCPCRARTYSARSAQVTRPRCCSTARATGSFRTSGPSTRGTPPWPPGLDVLLETWQGAGHAPYTQFRTQILTQTRNFLWSEMDLRHAAH